MQNIGSETAGGSNAKGGPQRESIEGIGSNSCEFGITANPEEAKRFRPVRPNKERD
jgi:hypothetical protein